jgi:hypothetical protein
LSSHREDEQLLDTSLHAEDENEKEGIVYLIVVLFNNQQSIITSTRVHVSQTNEIEFLTLFLFDGDFVDVKHITLC